jgi:hypothetical protein
MNSYSALTAQQKQADASQSEACPEKRASAF